MNGSMITTINIAAVDKVRPYRTNNLYAEIQQKIKEQEELQLEQQHSKGKA